MNLPVRVLAALLLASAGSFAAGVPAQLIYQGRLLKADGSPVAEAIPLTFALYDTANSGSPLWSQTHSVDPSDGFFEVVLGDGTDASATSDVPLASVIDGRQLWLGIKAGSDPEMSPRTAVGSAPYAMLAQPVAHAQTHMKGGGDEIASYDAAPDRIPMAGPSGALDPAWVPMLPLAKGGTGTATPRITRNLCIYVATTNVPTPMIPLAPNLENCVATRAFATARQPPNVAWNFVNIGGALFSPLQWLGNTYMETSDMNLNSHLSPADVISVEFKPQGVFHESTFCLQISCDASF
jgi:hypothetical protein